MTFISGFYKWFQVLSLDVALGAVATAMFVAKQLDVSPAPYAFTSLGITVWLIYTFDHLLDGQEIKGEALTYRHRYHQRYFFPIIAFMLLTGCIKCVLHFATALAHLDLGYPGRGSGHCLFPDH